MPNPQNSSFCTSWESWTRRCCTEFPPSFADTFSPILRHGFIYACCSVARSLLQKFTATLVQYSFRNNIISSVVPVYWDYDIQHSTFKWELKPNFVLLVASKEYRISTKSCQIAMGRVLIFFELVFIIILRYLRCIHVCKKKQQLDNRLNLSRKFIILVCETFGCD